ncbi:thaumatin-like protein [Aristolochia californica]|uniref:thaumatin-like protein n=1 Tax=Aristolochia californica TaxID=171875 RepID=UPI0035D6122E
MELPSLVLLLFLLCCRLLFSGPVNAEMVSFYVTNKCSFPIWPATASNAGLPIVADGGFYLPSGGIQKIHAPFTWSGRIWARTDCNFSSSSKPACQTGDCDGRLKCNGVIGLPPVTLVQVALQQDKSKPSFYDVSLVDGYNLPVSVSTKATSPSCSIDGCTNNIKRMCPSELQVTGKGGEVVACKSACLAFNLDVFCCRNAYGSPEKCKPNMYSKMFKKACPDYYSYAYDSPPPLVSCSSNEYVITFCPSKWGDHAIM